jgi:carbon-monoxide dehydrogenase medium subunit
MPDYVRPNQTQEALEHLSRPGSRPVMVGPRPEPWPYDGAEALVDLGGLGLAHLASAEGGGLRLGGLAPLAVLAKSPLLAGGPGHVLAQAAWLAAQPGLLRVATLAGALLSARAAPEVRLALLALDAEVVIATPGGYERQDAAASVPVGSLVVEVELPMPTGGAALGRVARAPRDQAIVAAVARVAVVDGVCQVARLALAGTSARPGRVPGVEAALQGQAWTSAALDSAAQAAVEAAVPVGDFRGRVEYRRAMAGVLARRVLAEAAHNGGQ